MTGNTFGKLFRVTTCGESHGGAIAVIVDGCPAGLAISEHDIQAELDRRKPGQCDLVSPRKEADRIHVLAGVFEGVTTGAPVLMLAHNTDMRPADYDALKNVYRPSHADFTWLQKYGRRDVRGSGRASARETLARVAAGAIAQKFLKQVMQTEIVSYVEQTGDICLPAGFGPVSRKQADSHPLRCPDPATAGRMQQLVETVREAGDSIGGVIRCVIRNVMPGLGEPVFDKLSADLGKAMLSINAVKGFEIGEGFSAAHLRGSEHNDGMAMQSGKPVFLSNHAGGMLGGISTGEDICFRVAFKPVSSIRLPQKTVTVQGEEITLSVTGRHDPCVLPRAVPIVDAMAAIVLMDHYLRQGARQMKSIKT